MRVPQVSERIKEAPAQALRGVFAGIGQLLLLTDKLRNKAPADRDVPRARGPERAGAVTDATVTSPAARTTPAADAATAVAPAAAAAATAPGAGTAETAPAQTSTRRAPAKPITAKPPAKPTATRRAPAAKPATAKPATAKPATAKPATAKPATAKPAATGRAAAKPTVAGPADGMPKPPQPQRTRDLDKTGNVRLLGSGDGGSAPAALAAPLPNYDELSVASLRARLRNLDVTRVRQLAEYERAHAARDEVLTMFERRIAKLEAEA